MNLRPRPEKGDGGGRGSRIGDEFYTFYDDNVSEEEEETPKRRKV